MARSTGYLASAHHGLHRTLYERLGPRYLRLDVASVLVLLHVVALGGMGVTLLYVHMSTEEFLRLVIASQLLFAGVTFVAWRVARGQLTPIEAWLQDRKNGDVHSAWRSAVRFPFSAVHSTPVLLAAAAACLVWDTYAAAELGVDWTSVAVLAAGSAITFLYWMMLAFLSLEHGFRPAIDELAAALPEEPPLPSPRISLRLRLLSALPAINVITGVVVAGVFPGRGGVRDLAIGIGAALAVSASVSLWLTNLLTDSVVAPVARLREAAERVGEGELDVRIPVSSGDETGELARSFNGIVRGLKRRERLREAFGAYVDPELAERVEKESVVSPATRSKRRSCSQTCVVLPRSRNMRRHGRSFRD